MVFKSAYKNYNKETMSRAVGLDLPISTKQSIEICSYIRKMGLQKAKSALIDTINMRKPIPFKRFTNGVGHRKGKIAAGRYPQKACKEILKLLESAEINAQQKGLNTSRLGIVHITANKASEPIKPSRQRGRKMKRTHIEIVLGEIEESKKKETTTKKIKEQKNERVESK